MTDAELGKWLRKELTRLQRQVADNRLEASGTRKIMATEMAQERKLLGALIALVALLGEAAETIASTGEWGDPGGCWCTVLSTACHTEHCQKRRDLLARLRVVLPEGR